MFHLESKNHVLSSDLLWFKALESLSHLRPLFQSVQNLFSGWRLGGAGLPFFPHGPCLPTESYI